ncbi:MAG: metalloregulator ArsR/SmtB family transcription factor [Chloroflexi bacterium]|jgi:predicted transcriptional regulator|nr:metalloregulator ArsR/SmtB family transcription factor [Chloroflexota bacterium]
MKNQPYENQAGLLDMLKALADQSRLTLLRILSEGEITVSDLARRVDLSEPTVSHHLSRLRAAGLVTLRMAGNQRYYCLNEAGLKRFKKMAAEIEQAPAIPEPQDENDSWITGLGWSASDQQVLREYTRGEKITRLPSKQKKLIVILRWLATLFEPDRLYTEREVNEVLKSVYAEDYVGLRRDLVDMGYLRRERGGEKYWLGGDVTRTDG